MRNLIIILGDQLSKNISSLSSFNKEQDEILMAEVKEEATYVKHHKKKIILLFSAMRHFAEGLRADGYKVNYIKYTDAENKGSIHAQAESYNYENCIVTEPGEWRLLKDLEKIKNIEILQDNRFIASHAEFEDWATDGRKELTMEYFYREMRKKTGYLMNGDKPEGGKWNYDKENRKSLPKNKTIANNLSEFRPDEITKEVIELVETEFSDHFGDAKPFRFAVTRSQALEALQNFVEYNLANYGAYQDAMAIDEPFLYHSVLSPYINCGLLSPAEVCEAAIEQYENGNVPLNSVEGFVRQIIGWREFIRGVYWLKMPEYKDLNTLNSKTPLPDFYWGAPCKMKCVSEVVKQTKEEAYSHHIQRLMITGNFALLAGLDVMEVCDWYLAVYADAYEWVELPNTLGMALHADGAVVGTKPYISSGSYINKMSNFCGSCEYNVKEKTTDDACPFNYLYWNFLDRHRDKFENNRRMGIAYNNLNKMDTEQLETINNKAKEFIDSLG